MAGNGIREQLLAAAKARHRAAGQKVSRLERNGIRVRKEGLDPRQAMSAVEAMSTRQLRSYVNRLNTFTSRSTGYVAGHQGRPINAQTWRQYQRLERIYNKQVNDFYNGVKGLRDPVINKTVQQRLDDLREAGTSPRAGDYRTFNTFDRTAGGITSNESMKKLLKQMQKRVDPAYLKKEATLQRRILSKMLRKAGMKDLIDVFKNMSDADVITVTQYTDFMKTLEGSYAMAKSTSSDRPRWQSSVYEDNEDKIRDWANWASNHFQTTSEKKESEQDADDTPQTKPGRDRFGRFAREGENKPDPEFARDERGRFKPRRTPRFTPGTGEFNPDHR